MISWREQVCHNFTHKVDGLTHKDVIRATKIYALPR